MISTRLRTAVCVLSNPQLSPTRERPTTLYWVIGETSLPDVDSGCFTHSPATAGAIRSRSEPADKSGSPPRPLGLTSLRNLRDGVGGTAHEITGERLKALGHGPRLAPCSRPGRSNGCGTALESEFGSCGACHYL